MDNNSNSKMNELLKQKNEHEWIKEREPGQYGELYNICSKCRVDINLSFIHR